MISAALIDVLAAFAIVIMHIAIAVDSANDPVSGWGGPMVVAYILAIGIGAPIAVRRKWPRATLAITLPASMIATLINVMLEPYLAVALAVYWIARTLPNPQSLVALASALGGAALSLLFARSTSIEDSRNLIALVWLVVSAAWSAGFFAKVRLSDLARESDLRMQEAVIAERLRIARELHDIVAHNLTLITVASGTANHLARNTGSEISDVLSTIEDRSRKALFEMRQLLGVLRSNDLSPEALAPKPGLGDIPKLIDQAKSAGLDITLTMNCDEEVPEGLSLTAYRLVQEALTNVLKHAGSVSGSVNVWSDRGALLIDIWNEGHDVRGHRNDHVPGYGISGMQERIRLFGGTFRADSDEGGFRVRARIPYDARDGDTQ